MGTSESPTPLERELPAGTDATLPTGMLTFLIADVRGYTAYTHRHGDEAGARLATRFAALAGEAVALLEKVHLGGMFQDVVGCALLA